MAQKEEQVRKTAFEDITQKFFNALIAGGKAWQDVAAQLSNNPNLTKQLINLPHPTLQLKPLQLAFLQGDDEVCKWLLRQGATLDSEIYFPIAIRIDENMAKDLAGNMKNVIGKLASAKVGALIFHQYLLMFAAQTLSLYAQAGEDKKTKGRMALHLGNHYLNLISKADKDTTKLYLEEAYSLCKEVNDECNQAAAAYYLGKFFFKYKEKLLEAEKKFIEAEEIYKKMNLPLLAAIVRTAMAEEKLNHGYEEKEILRDIISSNCHLASVEKGIGKENSLEVQKVIGFINFFLQARVKANVMISAGKSNLSKNLINALKLFNTAFIKFRSCKNPANTIWLEMIRKQVQYLLKSYEVFEEKINIIISTNMDDIPDEWLIFCKESLALLFNSNISIFWKTPEEDSACVKESQEVWVKCGEIFKGNKTSIGLFHAINFCLHAIFSYSSHEYIGLAQNFSRFLGGKILKGLCESAGSVEENLSIVFSEKLKEEVHVSKKLVKGEKSAFIHAVLNSLLYFLALASGNSLYKNIFEESKNKTTIKTDIKRLDAGACFSYHKFIVDTFIASSFLAIETEYNREFENSEKICRLIEYGVLGLQRDYAIHVADRFNQHKNAVVNHIQRDFIWEDDREEYLFFWYEKLYAIVKQRYEKNLKKAVGFNYFNELGRYLFFYQEFFKLQKQKESAADIYKLLAEPIQFKIRTNNDEIKTQTVKFGVLLARHIKFLAQYLQDPTHDQDKKFRAFADVFSVLKSVRKYKYLLAPALKGCSMQEFMGSEKLRQLTKEIRAEGMDIVLSFMEEPSRNKIVNLFSQQWKDKKGDISCVGDLDFRIKDFWIIPRAIYDKIVIKLPRPKVTYEIKNIPSVSYQSQKSISSNTDPSEGFVYKPKKDSSLIVSGSFWKKENEDEFTETDLEESEEFILDIGIASGTFEFLSNPESALSTPEPGTPIVETRVFNPENLIAGLENLKKSWQIPISEILLPKEQAKDLYTNNKLLFDTIKVNWESLKLSSDRLEANQYAVLFDLILIAVNLSRIGFGKIQSPFLTLEQIGYFRDILCDRSELFLGKDDSYLNEALEFCSDYIMPYVNYIIDGTEPLEKIYCVNLDQHPKFKNISIEVSKKLKKKPLPCIEHMLEVIQTLKQDTSLEHKAVVLANLGNFVRILRVHHSDFCNQHFNSRLSMDTFSGKFRTSNVFSDIANSLLELNAFRNRVTHDENFSLEKYQIWVELVEKDMNIFEQKLLTIRDELKEAYNPSKDEESDDEDKNRPATPTFT